MPEPIFDGYEFPKDWKPAKRCIRCGWPVMPSKVLCMDCAQDDRERLAEERRNRDDPRTPDQQALDEWQADVSATRKTDRPTY